ncbi:rhodanese-like domain-containing protein [Geopsychrobacter electrodiphilus]|uniref:rhodanese-like domain-containing protein n=1 Tax=Geopsychrobacter electrodiphilus TaxID=225196 RepID=UPI0003A74137|nr:rhodanese-like domain-containing protein [Geopsychrobacter electrodiphilus]
MNEMKATRKISIHELKTMMATGDKPLLLDVLPQTRYQQKHIADAENTCVFEVNFLEQVASHCAAKNQPIVFYGCNDKTLDAKTAADKLHRAGYAQVSVLDGGLAAWQAAGNPVDCGR